MDKIENECQEFFFTRKLLYGISVKLSILSQVLFTVTLTIFKGGGQFPLLVYFCYCFLHENSNCCICIFSSSKHSQDFMTVFK